MNGRTVTRHCRTDSPWSWSGVAPTLPRKRASQA